MKGVVHCGGHLGEEIISYLNENRDPIILFEPQVLDYYPHAGAKWVHKALGDHSGKLQLNIPDHLHTTVYRNTQSASGLSLIPERAHEIGWSVISCDILYVDMIRFDEWAKDNFIEGSCSLLVIDVQGMEFQVLNGFGKHINGFAEIKVECSREPIYEGGSSAQEVIDYLGSHDFMQETPILEHGDIIFKRIIS